MASITLNNAQLEQYVPGSYYWRWRNALLSYPGGQLSTSSITFDSSYYNNLKELFSTILTPLDNNGYGGKYLINSCFREEPIGKRQHGVGQAVDITHKEGKQLNKDLFFFIKDNPGIFDYDQMIWEFSDPKTQPYPGVIHISYDPAKTTQRKMVLWSPNNGTITHPWDDKRLTGGGSTNPPSAGSSEDKVSGQLTTTKTGEEQTEEQEKATRTWEKTFQQALNNIANLELSDVEANWGQGTSPKDCDWISLKQFLLYLGTRYTPQSIYPFVELIPAITLDESGTEYKSDSTKDEEVESNINNKDEVTKKQKLKKQAKSFAERIINKKAFDYAKSLPPSVSRTEVGRNAFNNATGIADLFNLDPFHDDFDFMGQPSEAGIIIKSQRNIGVRAYGQLVLSPGAIANVPSKPGPIGFNNLEVQAGAQCENGIALISMSLQDVQGNKFTDLASPWAFIYDARPGNIGGDFWFRYGWQVRCPDPNDKSNKTNQLFWNHPGWALFGDDIKEVIKSNLNPANPCVMLTQAINGMGMPNPALSPGDSAKILYNLFDEGLIYNESNGTVTLSRNEGFLLQNYVKLSILNPELEVDENAAMTAKLSFRTTGAIAQSIPLVFARALRVLVKGKKVVKLGDLLLTAMMDTTVANYYTIINSEQRATQIKTTNAYFKKIYDTREFGNLVYVLGLEEGGNTGSIHPDEVLIEIEDDYVKEMLNPPTNGEDTIIRWLRNVLEDNGCELNSAATGSGAGINAAWVITVTKDYEKNNYRPITKVTGDAKTKYVDALDLMMSEKDVFSYRFQGSLVTSINIEKTETPNALKIQMDYDVSDFETYKSTNKSGKFTLEDFQESFKPKSTLVDRERNLRILFSQLQNVKITCIAHPWLGPGKRIFVKGMGFFDGEYLVLEVTHSLGSDMVFKSEIKAARMLLKDDQKEDLKNAKEGAKLGVGKNFTERVTQQKLSPP